MLQPAVEAFFLVHATERESKPPVRDTRESQLAHIKDEPPPLSPAPLTPATPSSLDPFFSREPSSMHISSSLPPDTQKFLRFAGTGNSYISKYRRFHFFYRVILCILFLADLWRERVCVCVSLFFPEMRKRGLLAGWLSSVLGDARCADSCCPFSPQRLTALC